VRAPTKKGGGGGAKRGTGPVELDNKTNLPPCSDQPPQSHKTVAKKKNSHKTHQTKSVKQKTTSKKSKKLPPTLREEKQPEEKRNLGSRKGRTLIIGPFPSQRTPKKKEQKRKEIRSGKGKERKRWGKPSRFSGASNWYHKRARRNAKQRGRMEERIGVRRREPWGKGNSN